MVVSEQDILDMISTLDANTGVGPDIISNTMLIAVKVQISKPLCMLLFLSFRSETAKVSIQ
jgi:hypothetical protein